MSTLTAPTENVLEELEETIAGAMRQINVKKETDLCHYLPGKGGKLHHFAYGKLKKSQPIELIKMIKEHILSIEAPHQFSSKPRSGLIVKRQVEVKFKRSQINRLVDVLKKAGDWELISLLSPHQTLSQVQKLMMEMVRAKNIDQSLWETYVCLVEEERGVST